MEGICCCLSDSDVCWLYCKPFIELPAVGTELKRPIVFFVLDEKHGSAGGSYLASHLVDSIHGTVDVKGRPLARTQGSLDVDDEESRLHDGWFGGCALMVMAAA